MRDEIISALITAGSAFAAFQVGVENDDDDDDFKVSSYTFKTFDDLVGHQKRSIRALRCCSAVA